MTSLLSVCNVVYNRIMNTMPKLKIKHFVDQISLNIFDFFVNFNLPANSIGFFSDFLVINKPTYIARING